MKNLKLLLVVFAVILSSTVSAKEINLANPDSVSVEIERILEDVKLAKDCEPLEITVFFSVSEDQKIQSLSVASPNGEVNEYIQKQLANSKLPEGFWMKGKIYELTVVKSLS